MSNRWRAVKQFQADRLRATYPDLLASNRYAEPCEFFLDELYGGLGPGGDQVCRYG